MGYKVDWTDEALDDLGRIWNDAADRNDVTRAQFFVDTGLERNPLACGHEVSEGLRVWQVEPLRVYFEVDTADAIATVTQVRRSPP